MASPSSRLSASSAARGSKTANDCTGRGASPGNTTSASPASAAAAAAAAAAVAIACRASTALAPRCPRPSPSSNAAAAAPPLSAYFACAHATTASVDSPIVVALTPLPDAVRSTSAATSSPSEGRSQRGCSAGDTSGGSHTPGPRRSNRSKSRSSRSVRASMRFSSSPLGALHERSDALLSACAASSRSRVSFLSLALVARSNLPASMISSAISILRFWMVLRTIPSTDSRSAKGAPSSEPPPPAPASGASASTSIASLHSTASPAVDAPP